MRHPATKVYDVWEDHADTGVSAGDNLNENYYFIKTIFFVSTKLPATNR